MYQKSFKKLLLESWLELEGKYCEGQVNPQRENDVVCYLYHALANRFKDKGFPYHWIKTEDTFTLKNGQLRPDLNLRDRVFVEVKIYPLRKFSKGWKKKQENIEDTVNKLLQYVDYQKNNSKLLLRHPALAIWFRKKGEKPNSQFIDTSLEDLLKIEKEKYKNEVTILFGPRKIIT